MLLSEMIKKKSSLRNNNCTPFYSIQILSNITTNPLNEILEYKLQTHAINAEVTTGNYDNILQDITKGNTNKLIIVFWEVANILDYLCYKIELIDENDFNLIKQKIKQELKFFFQNISHIPLVLFNEFSVSLFTYPEHPGKKDKLTSFANELNIFIKDNAPNNVTLIALDQIIATVGIENAVDWRFFSLFKALYNVKFHSVYCDHILPHIFSSQGKIKKAIIFDCDNTLWKGILAEDGYDGIRMSFDDPDGIPFAAVQAFAISLAKQGVLIGICSKNNPDEIHQVFAHHPHLLLNDEYLSIKLINWQDKATNLMQLAKELNIALESIIFVDDSDFEINLIQKLLPTITTIQVPQNIYNYPAIFKAQIKRLISIDLTSEDLLRTKSYQDQVLRKEEEKSYKKMDEYLASLSLEMKVFINHEPHAQRIAQLLQKTNQFNLTTKRYNLSEVHQFIQSKDHLIFSFNLSDKFGDYGITGLAIIRLKETQAIIDSFLMSCRVIGRNIEFNFFYYIVSFLSRIGILYLEGQYIPTPKNELVANFYEEVGMQFKETKDKSIIYEKFLSDFQPINKSYIRISSHE